MTKIIAILVVTYRIDLVAHECIITQSLKNVTKTLCLWPLMVLMSQKPLGPLQLPGRSGALRSVVGNCERHGGIGESRSHLRGPPQPRREAAASSRGWRRKWKPADPGRSPGICARPGCHEGPAPAPGTRSPAWAMGERHEPQLLSLAPVQTSCRP
jgi:hypothetical protein